MPPKDLENRHPRGQFKAGNKHGGQSTGRIPDAEKFGRLRDAAKEQLAVEVPQLIRNMLILANGVTVQEADKEGGVKVYKKAPDYRANEYLLNRMLGKPQEHVEVSGSPESPLTVIFNTALDKIYRDSD